MQSQQYHAPPRVQEDTTRTSITPRALQRVILQEFLRLNAKTPRVLSATPHTPVPLRQEVVKPISVQKPSPTMTQALPTVAPIASRTQAAQATTTKLVQGPAKNTRSHSIIALERALHAASFLDDKSVNAKRLATRKFPPAIFAAALAVMDIDSGKMLKHRQLTNHQDQDISRTWNTSTANKIGRLMRGKSVVLLCSWLQIH